MSGLLQNRKTTRKNQKYWKIQKILPPRNKFSREFYFRLHNERWDVVSHFCLSGWFLVRFYYRGHRTIDQFKVRAGIVEESGKEIVSSNAEVESSIGFYPMLIVQKLIFRTQLVSILKLKKVLNFFVEIKRKGKETEIRKYFFFLFI